MINSRKPNYLFLQQALAQSKTFVFIAIVAAILATSAQADTISISGGSTDSASHSLADDGTTPAVTSTGGTSSAVNTLSGALSLTGNSTFQTGTVGGTTVDDYLTVSGVISGSSNLTKTGAGQLTLTAANTYSGTTTISGGTLSLSGSGLLASTSITVNNGGTLLYSNVVPKNGADQTITVNSGGTVEFNMTTTGRSASTAISNGKNVIFAGDGTWVKSGTGDLHCASANNQPVTFKLSSSAQMIIKEGAFYNGGWQKQNWSANYAELVIKSAGMVDLWDGTKMQIGGLTGESGSQIVATASGAKGLTIGSSTTSTQTFTYDGTILCDVRPTITKTGASTQILTGAISNVALEASAGTLKVNTITNSDVTVKGGAFDIGSDSSKSYALDLGGSLTLSSGSVGFDFNALTFDTLNATAVTISGGSIAVNFSTNQEQAWFNNGTDGYRIVSAPFSTTADLTSKLTGTTLSGWTLTQKEDGIWLSSSPVTDNLYWNPASDSLTDAWAIDGANKIGVRYNSGDVKAATHSGTISQSFKSTYDIAEGYNLTQSGVISGIGNLVKTGDGTLTLTAANTYTGETIVSDGTLTLSGNGKIAAPSITVEEGAKLLYDNTVPHNGAAQTINIDEGATVEFKMTTTGRSSNTAISQGQLVTFTGDGTFIKSGSGDLWLQSANTQPVTFALSSKAKIIIEDGKFSNGGWKNQTWTDNESELIIKSTGTLDLWNGNPIQISGLTGETGSKIICGESSPQGMTFGKGVSADKTYTFNGTINCANRPTLTKTGAGTQIFKGDITNVKIVVNDGVLELGTSGSPYGIGATSIIYTTDSGVIQLNSDVNVNASYVSIGGSWTGDGSFTVGSSGQLRVKGTLNLANGVTLNGGLLFNDGDNDGKEATLNGPVTVSADSKMQAGWSSYLMLTQGLYGAGAININTDSGWIYVTAEGDYTGSITAQGKLRTGAVNTGSVGSLVLADSFIGTKAITLNGGTLCNNNNYLEYTNDLNVIAASNLQAGWSKGVTFSGALSGAGNMTIANDSGWVNMATDASQYTGAFTVAGKMGMGAYGTDVPDSAAYIGNKTITLNGGTLGNNYNDAVYTNDIVVSANSSLQARGENKTTTFTGALSGEKNLTIAADAGVVVVATTCNNEFTGNVIAANGTGSFRLGADNPFGSSVGTATIGGTMDMNGYDQAFTGLISASGYGLVKNSSESPSTLTLNVADEASHIYNGSIEDDVKVVKNGTGTQTFNGENSYTGGTDINAGTLVAGTSTALGTGAVNVNGGTLQVGADSLVPLTLTVGNTQLSSGAIAFDFNANGFDAIEADSFSLSGGNFNINFPTDQEQAWFNNGAEGYKILSATFGTTADLTSYMTGTTLTGWTLSQKEDGIYLYSTSSIDTPYWNPTSDSLTDAWDIDGANKLGVRFNSGETTELTHSGTVTQTFKSTYDIAEGYNLTQSGVISGTANLVKTGDGTLTLTVSNTFTGETIVSDGTLTLSGSGKLVSSSITVEDGATLLYDNTVPHNTALQTITINGGTVEFYNTTESTTHTNDNGICSGVANQGVTINGTNATMIIDGGGTVSAIAGTGKSTLTVALDSNSVIDIKNGMFINGGYASQNWSSNYSALKIGATGVLNLWDGTMMQVSTLTGEQGASICSTATGSVGDSARKGLIVGAGITDSSSVSVYNGTIICDYRPTFTKVGAGTQVFNGSVTKAAFVVNEGVLEINGTVDAADSLFTVNGGTLKLGGTATLSAGAVTNNGTIEFAHSSDVEIANAISGTGALIKSGSGTLTLTQEPGYTGSTTVKSGTLALTDGGTLYNLSGGSLKADGTIDVNATLNAFGKDLVLSNNEMSKFIGSITAKTIVKTDDGTLQLCTAAAGGIQAESFVVSSGRLDMKEYFKGTLIIGEKLDAEHYSTATFSPGNSIGTLTIDGTETSSEFSDFTLNSGSTLLIEIGKDIDGSIVADQLIVNGEAAFESGSIIDIVLDDASSLEGGTTFEGVIITANNAALIFDDVKAAIHSPYFDITVTQSGNDIWLTARLNPNAIPEPSTWALLALGVVVLFLRKRVRN